MKPKALQPEAAADPPAAIREESKDKEAAAAAAPPQAEGNTEEPSKAVDASAKAEETNFSPPQAQDQAAKVGGAEDKERVPAGAETGAPAGSEGNQGQTGQAAAKVEETEQAEPAPASEMVSDGKQETANLTAQAVSGADDKAGAGQAPDGGAKAGHGVEAEQVPASANAPPAPAVEEGAADPTAGGQQIPAASAAPPDQPGEGAMDVDVKTEGAQDLPSDQKTAADSEPKDDKNQVLASGDLQNPQILSQTPQAAGGGASLAGVPLTSGELNQPNQNASFYQVMQMHAAQAQGQAEAQAQAIQATRAHQVGVGSPISQGKAAPGSSPMRGVPYMNMPPQLQGMPMQVPKGFLVPQQMMVQAAQAQAQAQAQFQAQAQQVQAQAQAQFQAQQAQAQFQQARAQAVAQGQAKPKVGDKKDGSKKRKIEQQGKGPAKKPAAAKKKKPAKEKLTHKDAMEYLTKVKERFNDKLTVYNKFLDIMRKFGMKKINTAGVVELVKTLFKGHKDLLLGFNLFVPSGYEIRIAEPGSKAGKGSGPKGGKVKAGPKKKQPIEFNQAISYVNKIKKRFAGDERVYKAFLEILNMYRKGKKGIYKVYEEVSVLFSEHEDLLKEFTYFLPDSQPPPQLSVSKRSTAKSKDAKSKRATKSGTKSSKDEEDKKVKSSLASLSKELQFFERVKNRLRNKEAYQDFLKCLNIFSQEIISKMELQGLVYDIIGKYSDLVQGFNEFLSRCESMDLDLSVKNILGKDGKALEAARTSVSSKEMQQKLKAISMREKYNTRPISDLDLTMCEQCTPSYRKLPTDYPKMSFKGREKHKSPQLKSMFASMLNDQWVSLPTGTEDAYGFKSLRRNQYEESLFRCEDDRFELEMCIECNTATIKVLDEFAQQIPSLSDEEKRALVLPDNLLGPVHLRSIEKIYAEHGQNILDLLRRIPGYAVPIVHERLKEKDKEWRHAQSEMNKVWSKVYEQNYHKSLDHRSFYFKQIDKKNLSSKGIITEIKELSEERKKKQDMKTKMTKAIASIPDSRWTDQHMEVDIVFDCKDQALHNEIFGIVAYAADEMLSADLCKKVTKFWCEFFEPFFGLAMRNPEDRKNHSLGREDKDGDTVMEDKDGEGAEKKASDTANMDSSENSGDEKNKEEEENEEDSDPSLEFVHCKPIAAHLVSNGRKAGKQKAKTVFYGNDAFYVLFRLHNYLYERLAIVKDCVKKGDDKWRPSQKEGEGKEDAPNDAGKKVHDEFMQLLYRLIDGTTDISQYEDECRHLLGAKAYILFTVDKLIYKLVKQIQSIVTDDLLLKLQSLYDYEKERKDNLFDNSVYYANSLVLLNDETRFRIGVVEKGKVSAQILDVSLNKYDVPAVAMDKAFSDYLKSYVEFDSSVSAHEPGKVFLKRTLQGLKDVNGTDEQLPGELKNFYIWNGLECKIACNTSKVSYVLDTEDVLLRKGFCTSLKTDQAKKRKERFDKWIETEIEKTDEASEE